MKTKEQIQQEIKILDAQVLEDGSMPLEEKGDASIIIDTLEWVLGIKQKPSKAFYPDIYYDPEVQG